MSTALVPKPITVISRMEVSGHVLGMLDAMAAKHGLSRDDFLAMAVMLWISHENNPPPTTGPVAVGDVTREIVELLQARQRNLDSMQEFGGWGA